MPAGRVDDGREPMRDDRGGGLGRRLGQHEDRRVDARLAQLDAFLDERDAEPRRARLRARRARPAPRRGRSRRPSPPRAPRPARATSIERRDVVAHRAEVDLDPGGAEPLAHLGAALRWWPRGSGRCRRGRRCRATLPSSTTGTWVTSCSCISVATSSSVASGADLLEAPSPSRRRPWTTRPSSAPRRSAGSDPGSVNSMPGRIAIVVGRCRRASEMSRSSSRSSPTIVAVRVDDRRRPDAAVRQHVGGVGERLIGRQRDDVLRHHLGHGGAGRHQASWSGGGSAGADGRRQRRERGARPGSPRSGRPRSSQYARHSPRPGHGPRPRRPRPRRRPTPRARNAPMIPREHVAGPGASPARAHRWC